MLFLVRRPMGWIPFSQPLEIEQILFVLRKYTKSETLLEMAGQTAGSDVLRMKPPL